MTENIRHSFGPSRIDAVEQTLERWLLLQAQAGIPEVVLVGILQDYVDVIERRGVILLRDQRSRQECHPE